MNKLISDKKYLLILAYLSVGIFISLIIIIVLSLKKPKTTPEPNFLTPTPFPTQDSIFRRQTPAPTINIITPIPALEKLKIIKIEPEENISEKRLPIAQVKITFNNPVKKENFFYDVKPFAKTYLTQVDSTSIMISPETIWKTGIMIIIVSDKTFSDELGFLEKKHFYRLYTDFPEERPDFGPE